MRTKLLITGLALLPAQTVLAQTQGPLLNEAQEIALARSAAPAAVSASADIWVLGESGYHRAHRGTGGNACIVNRGWDPRELKPTCYDPEAAKTVLQGKLREHQLRAEGKTREEVAQIVGEEIEKGALDVPRRPALAYILSSSQRLVIDDEDTGNAEPHVMLYVPNATAADFGLAENTDQIMVIRDGTPNAFMIIVVPEFVHPEALATP